MWHVHVYRKLHSCLFCFISSFVPVSFCQYVVILLWALGLKQQWVVSRWLSVPHCDSLISIRLAPYCWNINVMSNHSVTLPTGVSPTVSWSIKVQSARWNGAGQGQRPSCPCLHKLPISAAPTIPFHDPEITHRPARRSLTNGFRLGKLGSCNFLKRFFASCCPWRETVVDKCNPSLLVC